MLFVIFAKEELFLDENKRKLRHSALKWTILIIALVQMPTLALVPAIQLMREQFGVELVKVQTAMSTTNFVSVLISLAGAFLINRRVISKKFIIVLGLFFMSLTALLAVSLHDSFWNVYMLSITLGLSTGCFVSNAFGLLFDNFEPGERQKLAGYQTSCINLGGIIMSLAGGLLASIMWYGGYLVLFAGLPVAILCLFTVPNYKTPLKPSGERKRGKINPRVYYYSGAAFFFMMLYNVCGSNISPHLKAMEGLDVAKIAGVCTALQMAGGVVSGIFFGRLSDKMKDNVMVLACVFVFIGFILLSVFKSTLIVIYLAVFIVGLSLSLFLPRCVYGVSTHSDGSNSATTSVFVTSIAPSMGGFFSPIILTNITEAIVPDSTVFRYAFVGCLTLVLGAVIAAISLIRTNRDKSAEKSPGLS